jgi:menaquinone-dependent protoporphyrinogen oxidase
MAQVLIVYGTAYGQTQRIARRILTELARQNHTVSIFKGDEISANLDLGKYQTFILAASVIRNQHQRYMRSFVRRHAELLNRVPTAFISVCGAAQASPTQAGEYVEAFLHETGLHPTFIQSFAGAMAYTRYGFFLRWVTRLVSGLRGGPTDMSRDHDMTDWEAVDRFAKEIAESLPPVREPHGVGADRVASLRQSP